MTSVPAVAIEAEQTAPGRVCDYVLMKLAARCNIKCTYCYWFRDGSVYDAPALLTHEAEAAFLEKLEEHVRTYDVERFGILFHGGEPLLIGPARFERLVADLRELERRLGFALKLSITTNGLLLVPVWTRLFRDYRILVTVSVDGPPEVHDASRIDFKGRGTFERVRAGIEVLRDGGIDPGLLAVCDPTSDPAEVMRFFAEELDSLSFDILVPDATHEDEPASIAPFYRGLFDLWYDDYAERGADIRLMTSISRGLLGAASHSESIGWGPVTTMTMLTDGALEPLDVLRTARFNITRTELNIRTHSLQDIQQDPLWREIRDATIRLAAQCRECPYAFACGGGHVASRWSNERRYDNPSVYCEDFKSIFGHAWERIAPDLYVEKDFERLPLFAA